jgi:phosphate transport system permease protein
MTDISFNTADVAAREVSDARVRKRYRSERRFRALGIAAIAVTGMFLAVVLADILYKGLPAFFAHSLTIDAVVEAEDVDPKGSKDPADIRTGDFAASVRKGLLTQFPSVSDRRQRRDLSALVSNSAAETVRDIVIANPALIGTTVKTSVLLSSDADLYMKGHGTSVTERAARGTITPSAATGNVTLALAGAPFADEISKLPAGKLDERSPSLLASFNGGLVKITSIDGDTATGLVLLPLASTASAAANWKVQTFATPESNRRLNDQQVAWLESFKADGRVSRHFATRLITAGDSREPEQAGIRGALIGSALTLLVTLALCLPIGIAAAVYLEEFAPKNRLTDLIEVNINNLAAVPSIVFGLLGLAMFLNFFNLPRSAPLVGGLVLALLVLPTIIIAARAALKSVPPSIKEAALGVGASHQQAVFHHVLPPAMPGIMTGTIIGMAHALGETAPLLMIGMVAFIVDIPKGITDAATVLPVQIYLWSDLPELGFQARTAAAIIILLLFLFTMNGLAIYLRRQFERRW